MAPINSRLWKAAQLAGSSAYFEQMVRAACQVQGKEFGRRLLFSVAATPAIVNGLTVDEGSSIDLSLLQAMVNSGPELDTAILNAVQAYSGPSS